MIETTVQQFSVRLAAKLPDDDAHVSVEISAPELVYFTRDGDALVLTRDTVSDPDWAASDAERLGELSPRSRAELKTLIRLATELLDRTEPSRVRAS